MTSFMRRNALVPLAAADPVLAAACGSSGSGKPAASGGSGARAQAPGDDAEGLGLDRSRTRSTKRCSADFTSDAQPNVTVNYNPAAVRVRARPTSQGRLVDFAGSDSLVVPRRRDEVQGRAFLYIPIVVGTDHDLLQPERRDKLQLSADTIAKIFSTHDHEVGRRRDQGRQPGRHAAVDADHGRAPQ